MASSRWDLGKWKTESAVLTPVFFTCLFAVSFLVYYRLCFWSAHQSSNVDERLTLPGRWRRSSTIYRRRPPVRQLRRRPRQRQLSFFSFSPSLLLALPLAASSSSSVNGASLHGPSPRRLPRVSLRTAPTSPLQADALGQQTLGKHRTHRLHLPLCTPSRQPRHLPEVAFARFLSDSIG
jgi:hypothetical protein